MNRFWAVICLMILLVVTCVGCLGSNENNNGSNGDNNDDVDMEFCVETDFLDGSCFSDYDSVLYHDILAVYMGV